MVYVQIKDNLVRISGQGKCASFAASDSGVAD